MSTSCAIYLGIGQSVFQERLVDNLRGIVPPAMIETILSLGATQIRTVIAPQNLSAVVQAYSAAVTEVFFIPAAASVVSFLLICGTRWTSLKKSENKSENVESDKKTLEQEKDG